MKQGYDKPLWQGSFPLDCNSWGRCQKVSIKLEIICRLNRRARSETGTSAVLLNNETVLNEKGSRAPEKQRFFDYPLWMLSSITVSACGFSRDALCCLGGLGKGKKRRKIFSGSLNTALIIKERKTFPVNVRVHIIFWQPLCTSSSDHWFLSNSQKLIHMITCSISGSLLCCYSYCYVLSIS